MERALWSAVTGMKAQELSLDTIANNLANINTTAFKASRINFQDMLYAVMNSPGSVAGDGQVPAGIQVGHGVRVGDVVKTFKQGSLLNTGNALDVAIEGNGFFEVTLPDGSSAYTRDGSFRVNGAGEVVTSDGHRVNGFDTVDAGTTDLTIAPDGSVTAMVNGSMVPKSRLSLVQFINPQGLLAIGRNLYQTSDASGDAQSGLNPGENGAGTLAQRHLESSNVSAAEELVNMISAQRAYEATSKAIHASDEMMQNANGLRR